MRPHKSTILTALVALILTAMIAVMAQQSPAQTPATSGDQKKTTESCCAMDSCCCNNGSCPMKQEGTTADADAKHDCCGDSCETKNDTPKGGAAKTSDKHECCCAGDSCNMKDMKNKTGQ